MVGENRVSLSHSGRMFGLGVICPLCHDGLYIRSRDRTSALTSFRENLIFSSLSIYSPTPKANKGFLRLPNSDRNLHAK
jgi:hypothetical protein